MRWVAAAVVCAIIGQAGVARGSSSFVTFESGQVRPLALSADGSKLFAVNTPDNQLEILDVAGDGSLTHSSSVPVGMEPVAVAVRSVTEVWVVNHLSDSISIVDVAATPPHVVRTLLVGDEPRDIVFAGSAGNRAFVTTAHRGQNSPVNPQLTTSSVGRADVWVFDADALGSTLGGTPLTVATLFGDTPRALAVSPDKATVYAAVFHSGNQTTAINETLVCNGGSSAPPCVVQGVTIPGGLPPPETNFEGKPRPETGLILRLNPQTSAWEDQLGRNWNNAVRFSLPDRDVFTFDANANPPVETGSFSGIGTILFNMAVNPVSGKVYVSNTEARNEVRFEGPGHFGGSTVRGHLHEARITVVDSMNGVQPRHLNKHINYAKVPSSASTRKRSLAIPTDMAISSNGATLYVAAFGSGKVGIFSTAEIEADSFTPSAAKQITIPGGGPSGLVLAETTNRLYVLTRFDDAVSVIDLAARREVQHVSLNNPEPFSVINGRHLLYDANLTSSNGEASCASCHVFGDFDSLGWDLGNPDDVQVPNPNPFRIGPFGPSDFHPMKGPMTTQTLRGMDTHGPMHWRGDRTGGSDVGGSALDESQAFKKFNVAFAGLLGRSSKLTDADMQAFTDFILQVTLPPNPIRNLDNSLTAAQQTGSNFYFNNISDGGRPCNGCHVLNTAAGSFGTDGFSSFEGETQHFKIPHLRNLYQKVGMFSAVTLPGFAGEQIRGFGFLHDGSVDTVLRFLNAPVFNFPGGNPQRSQVVDFLMAFDSNLAPIVGQQITLTSTNGAIVGSRIDELVARAAVGECDVVVKGVIAGELRGAYRTAAGTFQLDRAAEAPLTDVALRGLAATSGQELTYTCVPPGSGARASVDRDDDTVFDGDERDIGTDPVDPTSLPASAVNCAASVILRDASLRVRSNRMPAGDERLTLTADWVVVPQTPAVDPMANGLSFKVSDKDGNAIFHRVVPRGAAPTSRSRGWRVNRSRTRWTFHDSSGGTAAGITSVTVRDRSSAHPGQFTVSVTGRMSDFRIDPTLLPAQLLVVMGGTQQSALGQCATLPFNPASGARLKCSAGTTGDSVRCD
jgi:DNA-binding beta-propeller fold protein YncE